MPWKLDLKQLEKGKSVPLWVYHPRATRDDGSPYTRPSIGERRQRNRRRNKAAKKSRKINRARARRLGRKVPRG